MNLVVVKTRVVRINLENSVRRERLRRVVKPESEYRHDLFGFFEADKPGKPSHAEAFGFDPDNYYTADEKRRRKNRQGNMVAGPFSRFIPI